jgi:hypothetical protein
MAMPEAAMNEHGEPKAGKDQIGCARQALVVNSEAIAQSMSNTANLQLGFAVTRADLRHKLASRRA